MGRAPCCDKNGLKKGPWTPEEDLKLINYIQIHGPSNWRTLPKNAGLVRCGKSCRLRWTNYLRPDIKRGRFSFEEEETIIQLHNVLGNKWSAIAARLPGRTDNEIKNYWNTHIRKRLLRMGIDPVTHAPRLDLLDLSSILSSALCNQSLLNLSNFLRNQTLLNPELLSLLSNLPLHKQVNPADQFSQNHPLLEINKLFSTQLQNQLGPLLQQNQFQSCNEQGFISSPHDLIQSDNVAGLSNFGSPTLQENVILPSALTDNLVHQPNNLVYSNSKSTIPEFPESLNNIDQYLSNSNNHKIGFDSVMSTPALSSSTPLNSSSTYINGSSTEDEKDQDSYCSNLLKFEIPESFDINDFL